MIPKMPRPFSSFSPPLSTSYTYSFIMSKRMLPFLHILFIYFLLDSTLLQITLGNQCKLDFQQYEKRRIAAIKGQILSKLGLTAPPPDEGPDEVPRDVIEIFNDTVRLLEQKYVEQTAACQALQSDDFFAKVPILYHTQPSDWPRPGTGLHQYSERRGFSKFYRFDVSNYRTDAGSEQLKEAELKLYQVPNKRKRTEQKFSLYQLIPTQNEPRRKHLYSKSVNTADEGWITFDVTETVRQWVTVVGTNLGFELSLDCPNDPDDPDSNKLHIFFADRDGNIPTVPNGRGDQNEMPDHYMREQYPRLVIMAVSDDSMQNSVSNAPNSRWRRSATTPATPPDNGLCRDGSEPNCCLRALYVNFRKDLSWNWIRQPKGYYPDYCAGSCPYVWGADTQHSSLLHIYKALNPDASPSPCCSPKSFKPLHILYYENGSPKIKQLSNMIVTACKCS